MNAPFETDWQPDPQLLAAYFDGELEGRDEMADMRARIEDWLALNPQAGDEWANHRQLQELWAETTPAEPGAAAWSRTLERIEAKRRQPKPIRAGKRPWFAAGMFVASVALFIGLLVGALRFAPPAVDNTPVAIVPKDKPKPPDVEDVEVFAVAVDSEVTIFRIEGVDMGSLVVGAMPLDGPMELAERGEVRVIRCCPQTIQVRQTGRPMVSPRVDTE